MAGARIIASGEVVVNRRVEHAMRLRGAPHVAGYSRHHFDFFRGLGTPTKKGELVERTYYVMPWRLVVESRKLLDSSQRADCGLEWCFLVMDGYSIGAVDVWVPWKIDLPGVDRRRRGSNGRTPPKLLGCWWRT